MISVIVPAYNVEDTLGNCLAALQAQSVNSDRYEIIVVDDGSSDKTAEVALRYGVRPIGQPNGGPAAARNRGAQAALGDLLLFTDADCEPTSDWIAQMASAFCTPEVVGAKGVYQTRQKALVARFVQLEYEDRYAGMVRQECIDFVDTYSAAYRREVFLANGGFDTFFPTASVEDQEFSFRLARKGYRLVFIPQAVVYHRHDITLREYGRRKFSIGYWKAFLLQEHPERMAGDSHTPQVLKAQILLTGLLIPLLLLTPFWKSARWSALSVVACLFLTGVPFLVRAARRDPAVALVGPVLLVWRALTLGAGLAAGFLRLCQQGSPHRPPISGLNRAAKRAMDIVGSLVGLILATPLMAVLAVMIKLDSRGHVLFIQERVGENGRPFRMIKLRTMVDAAKDMLPEPTGLEGLPSPAFKLRDDPRVTRVGHFLRRLSLDELPQLWNVLKGEMSLVGPRPEEIRVVRLYGDWHRLRLVAKPGITGPMQVSGRADLSLDARVRLELDYITSYSLWKDVSILVRTAVAVISGRGAY